MPEKLAMWIAWHLPKSIVMWCYIRVAAKATVVDFPDRVPEEVNVMEALEVWN